MKMTFKLSDKQLDRAKAVMVNQTAHYHDVLDNFTLETRDVDGIAVCGYFDDICHRRYVWLGNILGFFKIRSDRKSVV